MPGANHPDLTALLARVGRLEKELGRTRNELALAKAEIKRKDHIIEGHPTTRKLSVQVSVRISAPGRVPCLPGARHPRQDAQGAIRIPESEPPSVIFTSTKRSETTLIGGTELSEV
jgi:hypothetical protein